MMPTVKDYLTKAATIAQINPNINITPMKPRTIATGIHNGAQTHYHDQPITAVLPTPSFKTRKITNRIPPNPIPPLLT